MTGPRYRISRRLGQGGMAEVFEAEVVGELGFVRKVAIKRMLGDAAADPGAARRFLDEARIASRLHHANIVAVTDVGLLDDLPFQVLEFVDGVDVQQLLHRAGGKLPLDVALAVTADVAHALDHAHRATDADGHLLGIVHRDVKPSNVLVAWSGDVKLADFGIALARDRAARTETGIVAGTLGFIAPEQRTRSEVDGRADVFALGLTLHAFLTGYTPLQDITVEMALLEGTPIPLDAALPADVKALIERAVAPARLARPSAGEFASAVGALLAPRLTRDARGLVREFLDTIDVSPNKRKRGALDDLLGIEVVPSATPDGDVRHYKTVVAKKRVEATTLDILPPPRPRRTGLFALVALLVVLGGGIGVWRLASSTTTTPDAAIADAAIEPAVDFPDVAEDVAEDVVLDAAPPLDAFVASKRPKPIDAGAPTPTPVAVETGWLQVVGGEELVGAQVLVDGGKWKFFVPHKHEVAVGSHRVEVIKPDGTKLPAKTIEVTTFHSMRNVAKLSY
ncbi:MAG: serine/threonine protein kinase [Myxococcota bacterium]|nr:serine/threonine protein kinase [Deltaproteobacteria bacterium]MDQ3335598.1 serine/threonine protein kinase [Myxococcota bacterium]